MLRSAARWIASNRVPSLYVIGYLFLLAAIALAFQRQATEERERRAFDASRAYELCLVQNESRLTFRDNIVKLADTTRDAFNRNTEALIAAAQANREPGTPAEDAKYQRQLEDYRKRQMTATEPLLDVKKDMQANLEPRNCEKERDDLAKGEK